MLAEYKVTLSPVTMESAQPDARAMLEATQKKMGFVPNGTYLSLLLLSSRP